MFLFIFIRRLLPRIYQIIEEINKRFMKFIQEKFPNDSAKQDSYAILSHGKIKMAHLAIVGSHTINGVAALHTHILETDVLKNWYELYPDKFQNKTNGITPRRWILKSNPKLTGFLDSKFGTKWHTDLPKLQGLLDYKDDGLVLDILWDIKQSNKTRLAEKIKEWMDLDIDDKSIYDIQIKRLHEYKRQFLNALHIITLYHKLKDNPALDIQPRTFIFGAKAASGYHRAKLIIKLINNIANVINNDPAVSKKIKVVFVPNYCVSIAEYMFPAADVSEQISTAGKEASGTGNMKFMANGAITVGTLDGANVEINEEVGAENCIIFGATAEEIKELRDSGTYNPREYYDKDPALKRALESLIDTTFTIGEDSNLFKDLYDSLLNGVEGNAPDTYFVLKDFASYCEAQDKVDKLYRDKKTWTQMSLVNIAKCGKFSSDRTIYQYATEIWDIKPVVLDN